MTDDGRKNRNAYYREYYHKNKEKIRAIQQRYWERKANKKQLSKEGENNGNTSLSDGLHQ